MCLSRVTSKQLPTTVEEKAWKIFRWRAGSLNFIHFNIQRAGRPESRTVIYDTWLQSSEPHASYVHDFHREDYPRGFHVFNSEHDAEQYARQEYMEQVEIKEVMVKGIHTRGIQAGVQVVVADHLMVPRGSTEYSLDPDDEEPEEEEGY